MRRVQHNLAHLPEDDRLHEKTGLAGLWEHKEAFWMAMVAIGTWATAVASLETQHHPIQKVIEVVADAGQVISDWVLLDNNTLEPYRETRKVM